jgi:YesN/AraC family two-component response regulator
MADILIVDDEVIFATQLEDLIISMGHNAVSYATNGEEALKIAREAKPDLILMDIRMPGMDGIETAELIRKEQDVPIIFMTAYPQQDFIDRAKTLSPLGYLIKPINSEQIRPTIELALHKRAMEKELKKAYAELEIRVQERTSELYRMNEILRSEIRQKERINQLLVEKEQALKIASENLEETNSSLQVLLKHQKEELLQMEEKVIANVREFVLPYIQKLQELSLTETQTTYVDIIEHNIKDITAPFSPRISPRFMSMTANDIQMINLLKQGKKSREIADILEKTQTTIAQRRIRIREKTGIKGKKANLRSHLLGMQ